MERRVSQRLELERPCFLQRDRPGSYRFPALTQNIGRSGALLLVELADARGHLQEGENVALEILLPENVSFGQRCLHCCATIVRIEECTDKTARVGVVFHHMEFRQAVEHQLDSLTVSAVM
jgi:PilZ domain